MFISSKSNVSNSLMSSKATSSVSYSASSAIVTAVSEESNKEYIENALTKFEPLSVYFSSKAIAHMNLFYLALILTHAIAAL